MRALVAATSYPRDSSSWEGRFIHDQVASLARQGIDIRLWAPPGELPSGVRTALQEDDANWLADLRECGGIAHRLRKIPFQGMWAARQLLRRLNRACRSVDADVYLFNWLQNALALPPDGRPLLATVLGTDFALLSLPGMRAAMRRKFRHRRTCLMPNAGWMVPELKASFSEEATIIANPFGVADAWFDVERQPPDKRLGWLVVSRITRAKLGSLFEWADGLFSIEKPITLLGPMQESITLPPWVIHRGATCPEALLRDWFPKVAGLLTLSQHSEGRPQVLIEAMAAGLPVIASRIPGHEDLIRNGETGWLVSSRSELGAVLEEAGNPARADQVGTAARRQVLDEIGTWDDCARRYRNACLDLLDVHHAG